MAKMLAASQTNEKYLDVTAQIKTARCTLKGKKFIPVSKRYSALQHCIYLLLNMYCRVMYMYFLSFVFNYHANKNVNPSSIYIVPECDSVFGAKFF